MITSHQYKALQQYRNQILKIAAANNVTSIKLFGSVVRSETNPESDIDFLVDFAPGSTLFDLAKLRCSLVEILGFDVDVVSSNALTGRLRDIILQEAREL